MYFFDSHCHLQLLAQQTNTSLAEIITTASLQQVIKFLSLATNLTDIPTLIQTSQLFPNTVYTGIGIHPWYIQSNSVTDCTQLVNYIDKNRLNIHAIGEIGLDKKINNQLVDDTHWQSQLTYFNTQLDIAKQFKLPVSIHSRRSHAEVLQCLKKFNGQLTGTIHAFSGSYQQAKNFIDLGFKIGVGSIISYANAEKTIKTISKLPLTSIVLETDSPDMLLANETNSYNHPQRLNKICHILADIRSEPIEHIAKTIWQTSCDLFIANNLS